MPPPPPPEPLDPFAQSDNDANIENADNGTAENAAQNAPLPDIVEDPILTRIQHEKRKKSTYLWFWLSIGISAGMWLLTFIAGYLQ